MPSAAGWWTRADSSSPAWLKSRPPGNGESTPATSSGSKNVDVEVNPEAGVTARDSLESSNRGVSNAERIYPGTVEIEHPPVHERPAAVLGLGMIALPDVGDVLTAHE